MQVPNDVTSVQIESMVTSMRFIYKRLCVQVMLYQVSYQASLRVRKGVHMEIIMGHKR